MTAYRTVRATPPPATTRDAIKTGKFDAVVFTSSSTVRNLVGIAGKPHPSTVIAVIGPATAKTAEEHGLRVDVLAPKPDVDVLVDALADFGAARRAGDARGRRAGHPPVRAQALGAAVEGALTPMTEDDAPELTGPLVRPRRLRRTPGLRRMVAETHVDPGQLVLPLFVREGITEPVPIASMPGVVQHTRDTLLKAVAEAADLGLGGVMLFGIPEHKDAVGSGAHRPGRHPQPRHHRRGRRGRRRAHGDERPVPRRVHRPRPLRGAHARRPGRQRPHPRGVRRDGAGPGRRRRRHGRPQRDDGRPGAGDPRRARRRRPHRRLDPGLLREVRLRLLRPVPRGGRELAARATGVPTSRTPPTPSRASARRCSTSSRARTSSW